MGKRHTGVDIYMMARTGCRLLPRVLLQRTYRQLTDQSRIMKHEGKKEINNGTSFPPWSVAILKL